MPLKGRGEPFPQPNSTEGMEAESLDSFWQSANALRVERELSQWMLPKGLSFMPRAQVKRKLGVVVCCLQSQSQGTERGKSLGFTRQLSWPTSQSPHQVRDCLKSQGEAEEVAQKLIALTVLPEELGSIPGTSMVACNLLSVTHLQRIGDSAWST